MFSRFPILILIVTVFTTVLMTGSGQSQQSYPMTCRGGGSLTIANDGRNGVRIGFEPGRGAAHEGLSPGQCTWSDRPLHPNEPTSLCDNGATASGYVGDLVRSDGYVIVQVYNDGRGCMRVTRVGP